MQTLFTPLGATHRLGTVCWTGANCVPVGQAFTAHGE